MNSARREWLVGLSSLSAGVVLLGCSRGETSQPTKTGADIKQGDEPEVTATEDLMREHGVLRRALLVYQETAIKLSNATTIPSAALQKTAQLFRDFGEEYHEKKLEEAYIFPAVKKAGGAAAVYADILFAQHQRGREITDFILATTSGAIAGSNVKPFATALESLVRMYEHHAAIEDTIVFPAWKETLNADQLDEMNDKFEEIEHEQFGEDGFENALKQIAEVEQSLGLNDLAQFTAPAPPAR
jgi:hemerythrin-like domain-containing protein